MTPLLEEELVELEALLAKVMPGPLEYRPYEHDDWGFIRGPERDTICGPSKPIVAIAREGGTESDHDEHRRNKTDPYGPNAELIVAAVNALPRLLNTIRDLRARVEWRTIESAQTTMERVLLWCANYHPEGRIVLGRIIKDGDGTWVYGDGMNGDWSFTHWQPLPPVPEMK